MRLDYLSDRKLREALCKQLRIVFVDLDRMVIDSKLVELVPVEFAKRHRVLPLAATPCRLTLVMDDPTDADVITELHQRTGRSIEVLTATHASIGNALSAFYDKVAEPDPAPTDPDDEYDPGSATGYSRRGLGEDLATRGEPAMRQAEMEQTITQLQPQYTALLQQHEAAVQALREQNRRTQLLLREKQDLMEALERLAGHLKDYR